METIDDKGNRDYLTKSDKQGEGLMVYGAKNIASIKRGIYNACDLFDLQRFTPPRLIDSSVALETMDHLLKRDKQREADGFPKKIKFRHVPGKNGAVIIVPTTEEEQLIHGRFEPGSGGEGGGQGEGEEGEVVGEQPIDPGEGEGEGEGEAGKGGGGDHGIDTDAYETGKKLAEELQLPDLKDKGKRVATDEYIFDLTDRHRKTGQLLDKKATIRQIIKTNMALNRLNREEPDPTNLIVGPDDKVYRVLSKERVYKSMAIVFFMRDYSGSMMGIPTEAIREQHLIIYSWLMYQYEKLVIPRFIVHDAEAKEVDWNTYYKSVIAGGTKIASGYKLINEIINKESLERDFNLYVFQGTDGEDWDSDGKEPLTALGELLPKLQRMGASVIRNSWNRSNSSEFERYLQKSGLLGDKTALRLFTINADAVTPEKNIEAVKTLIKP